MRAYAQKIGVSAGMISEIFRGHRQVSFRRAHEIARRANFSSEMLGEMSDLYEASKQKKARLVLEGDLIDLILNPLYYKTICALEILPRGSRFADLSSFLGVEKELEPVVEQLEKLGIIENKDGALIWNGQHMTLQEDLPREKIQNFFRQDLKMGAEALQVPADEREYTAVTFAASSKNLMDGKEMIRSFREKISDSMKGSEPDQIYQLSIQLRPVSNRLAKGETDALA